MANTRDFNSPGVFAAAALTTIPNPPTQGIAYRNETLTESQTERGWRTLTIEDMALYNQILYEYGSIINAVDKQGLLGWSNAVNYDLPALVFGSDNNLYSALQASGPDNGGTQDPISTVGVYWAEFTTSAGVLAQLANEDRTADPTGSDLVGYSDVANANQSTVTDAIIARPTSTVLASNSGAGGIGTTSGDTVQQEFDALSSAKIVAMCRTTSDSGTINFVAGLNVASISHTTGNYPITFSGSVGTAAYVAQATCMVSGHFATVHSLTASGLTVETQNTNGDLSNAVFSLTVTLP